MERFTAIFEQSGEWWIGYVEELPGANTQGRTIEEARENLGEAIQLIMIDNNLARKICIHYRTLLGTGRRSSQMNADFSFPHHKISENLRVSASQMRMCPVAKNLQRLGHPGTICSGVG